MSRSIPRIQSLFFTHNKQPSAPRNFCLPPLFTFFYSQDAAWCPLALYLSLYLSLSLYLYLYLSNHSQEAAWCPLRPATHPPLSCASSARTGAGAFFGSFAAAHPLQWNAYHMCDTVRAEWVHVLCIPNVSCIFNVLCIHQFPHCMYCVMHSGEEEIQV